MKRSGIQRKSPMARGSSVLRRGALVRQAAISRTAMKPKPAKRDPAETKAREVVTARAGAWCEGCLRRQWTDWSHRKARSQGGKWSADNGLALCRPCHEFCHAHPEVARRLGWVVRRGWDPDRQPVWLAAHGLVYLRADGSITSTERSAA